MFYLVRVTALVIWCTEKNLCSSNWLFTTQKNKITFVDWPPQGQNQEGGFQVHNPVLPALDSPAHRKFSQKQLQLDWQEDCSQADINRVSQMQKETKGTKTRGWKTCKIRQCIYELAEKTPQQQFVSVPNKPCVYHSLCQFQTNLVYITDKTITFIKIRTTAYVCYNIALFISGCEEQQGRESITECTNQKKLKYLPEHLELLHS